MNLYTVKHNNKMYTVKAKDSQTVKQFIKNLKDEMYNVTYKKDGIFHANLVKASSEVEAKQKVLLHFQKKKQEVEIAGVKLATESDFKPGKPVIDNAGCNIEDGWSGMYNGYIFSYDSKSNKFVITTPNNKYIKISGDLNPKQVIDDIIAGKQVIDKYVADALEQKQFGDVTVVMKNDNTPQIRWASIGTVSIEQTKKFIKDLQDAIKFAEGK